MVLMPQLTGQLFHMLLEACKAGLCPNQVLLLLLHCPSSSVHTRSQSSLRRLKAHPHAQLCSVASVLHHTETQSPLCNISKSIKPAFDLRMKPAAPSRLPGHQRLQLVSFCLLATCCILKTSATSRRVLLCLTKANIDEHRAMATNIFCTPASAACRRSPGH